MTQTIRARTAADFLSLVPHLAGYVPRDSVVLVPFEGSRSLGLLRFDLPASPIDAFAATAIGLVCKLPSATGLAIVIYANEAWHEGLHADTVEALRGRADACGITVGDALAVASDGWAGYLEPAPRTLHPLTQITAFTPPPEGDQASSAKLDLGPEKQRDAVAQAIADIDDAMLAVCGDAHGPRGDIGDVDPRALVAIESLDDSGRLWDESLTWNLGTPLPPYEAALMLWTMVRPGLRDVALAQWCHGVEAGARALDLQLKWEAGEPYPGGPLFLAGEGPRPNADRLLTARDLTARLASLASGRHRAAALAVAGWLSWALGNGTHASLYAAEALREDPALGLAEIVGTLTQAGRLPEWAFEQR